MLRVIGTASAREGRNWNGGNCWSARVAVIVAGDWRSKVQGSLLIWEEEEEACKGYCVGEKGGAQSGYSYCRRGNGVVRVLGHRRSRCW
jgi:hypothetical protein